MDKNVMDYIMKIVGECDIVVFGLYNLVDLVVVC